MELRLVLLHGLILILSITTMTFTRATAIQDCSPALMFSKISWNDVTISWNKTCFNDDDLYDISVQRPNLSPCTKPGHECDESPCQISISDIGNCRPIPDSCSEVNFTVSGKTSNMEQSINTTLAPHLTSGDWKLDNSFISGSTLNARWGPTDEPNSAKVSCANKALVDAMCSVFEKTHVVNDINPGVQGTAQFDIGGCEEGDVMLTVTYMAADDLTQTKNDITLSYSGDSTTSPTSSSTNTESTAPPTTSSATTESTTLSTSSSTTTGSTTSAATSSSTTDISTGTQSSSISTPDPNQNFTDISTATQSSSVSTPDSNPPPNGGLIAAISIGVLLAIVLILALVYCYIKKKLCFKPQSLKQRRRPSGISTVSIKSILKNTDEEENSGVHNRAVTWNEDIPMETVESDSSKKKRVVILNYEEFKEPIKKREGATKDSKKLSKTFREMGYNVNSHQNLNKDGTNAVLDELQKDKSMVMLILIILSHGLDRKQFNTADGSTMDLDHIRNRFTDSECPQLKDQPKILLSNFCRGQDIERQTPAQAFKRLSIDASHHTDASCYLEVPHHMITIHATVENVKALRDPEEGTIFVTSLCKILKKGQELQDMYNKLYEEMRRAEGTTPMLESFAPLPKFRF